MIRTIPEVGAALRQKYHWVADEEPIFLVMDNAGGHGTDDAKEVTHVSYWNTIFKSFGRCHDPAKVICWISVSGCPSRARSRMCITEGDARWMCFAD